MLQWEEDMEYMGTVSTWACSVASFIEVCKTAVLQLESF